MVKTRDFDSCYCGSTPHGAVEFFFKASISLEMSEGFMCTSASSTKALEITQYGYKPLILKDFGRNKAWFLLRGRQVVGCYSVFEY